ERPDGRRPSGGRPAAEACALPAARRGDRRPRPGRASRSVQRCDGGGARRANRRERRLDVRAAQLRLAAQGPRGAPAQGDRPAGRARRGREGRDGGARVSAAAHADAHEHHGPPVPHYSSRIKPETLGMYLFIASEIMLFGSFFTAYFFVRIVNGTPWPTPPYHLPVFVATVNTFILMTSSATMHWATVSIKRGNVWGMRAGLLLTFLMGLAFLTSQLFEYMRAGFNTSNGAFPTIFFCLTGLHGCHVFIGLSILAFMTIRAFRGHFSADHHHGVEIGGIYWHFVDVMWIVVFATVYIPWPAGKGAGMRNPLRSEAQAYRFPGVVIGGAAVTTGAAFV